MFSLILAFLLIALLSAMALVAINHLPWWNERAQIGQGLALAGLVKLETAYLLAVPANTPPDSADSVAPPVTGASDGGLSAGMQSYYGFLPRPPIATAWRYGLQGAPGSFQNLNYICVGGSNVQYAEYLGLKRLADLEGPGSAVLASGCGATTAGSEPALFPASVALTYYLQYAEGAP
jgi:hypothetical protein